MTRSNALALVVCGLCFGSLLALSGQQDANALAKPQTLGANISVHANSTWKVVGAQISGDYGPCSVTFINNSTTVPLCTGYDRPNLPDGGVVRASCTTGIKVCANAAICDAPSPYTRDTRAATLGYQTAVDAGVDIRIELGGGCL